MKNMKKNVLLVPFVVVLALMFVGLVSAVNFYVVDVEVDGADVTGGMTSGFIAGDVVPVRVWFSANEDQSNVEIEVEFQGYDETETVSQDFGYIEANTEYRSRIFNLRIPDDVDDVSEETVLYVTISSREGETREDYSLKLQRESNELDILSVDYNARVSAGEVLPVSVVVENNGYGFAEDNFVVVSIPSLGISARGYIGDLDSIENYDNDNHEEDAVQKTVYLKIPAGADSGVYELEIEVYNDDSSTVVSKLITIGDSASSMVLASVKNKDLNAGETVTYELIVVNAADDVKVFNIASASGAVLSVSVPSVITVGPDSSKAVLIEVTAASDAPVGTYTFSVDVDGEQTVFGANVVGSSTSASVVALTVVLVIIFVVLLAVLVVLLTRKEAPIEEVETSYY